eukprot:1170345-Pyramimonas_sp.AAC.1
MAEAGYHNEVECELCNGPVGSIPHRPLECPQTRNLREEMLSEAAIEEFKDPRRGFPYVLGFNFDVNP